MEGFWDAAPYVKGGRRTGQLLVDRCDTSAITGRRVTRVALLHYHKKEGFVRGLLGRCGGLDVVQIKKGKGKWKGSQKNFLEGGGEIAT